MAEPLYATASAPAAATGLDEREPEPVRYPVGGYSGVYFPDNEPSFHPLRGVPAASTSPAPKRRGGAAGVVAAVMTVLVFLGAFGLRVTLKAALGNLFNHQTTYTVNDATTDHTGDLRQLIVAAPSPSSSCDSSLPNTAGRLSLDQQAALSKQPAIITPMLKAMKYQRGALRCWAEPDGTMTMINLLQFDTPAHSAEDSQFYPKAQVRTFGEARSLDGAGGVPGGQWFVVKPEQCLPGFQCVVALAQRGDITVDIEIAQPGSVRAATIRDMMRQQYGRL